jgi:hypothetical protein
MRVSHRRVSHRRASHRRISLDRRTACCVPMIAMTRWAGRTIDRQIGRATVTSRNSDNEIVCGLKMRIPKTILGFGTNVQISRCRPIQFTMVGRYT